jgi:hypothetical protein
MEDPAVLAPVVPTAASSATEDQGLYNPFVRGSNTVPKIIDDLGSSGVKPAIVAILRYLWQFGKSDLKLVYQPQLVKTIGISVRTAQRLLTEATRDGLIMVQISKQRPRQGLGHLCEYGIHFPGIYKKLGIPPGTLSNASKEPSAEEIQEDGIRRNAMNANWLPERFFKTAFIKKDKLHVVTKSDVQYILPDDGGAVLKYLTESHYHRSLPERSIDTLIGVAKEVQPRLLSLFALALDHSKTEARSPGY